MRKWLNHSKNEKGLTLVELLAVVVILGIIAAIAVPSIGNIVENSKKDAAVSNAQLVLNAARLHLAAGGETGDSEGISNYHETIVDPWSNTVIDEYTVVFDPENSIPAISIKFNKCDISEKTAQDLSQEGRSVCDK